MDCRRGKARRVARTGALLALAFGAGVAPSSAQSFEENRRYCEAGSGEAPVLVKIDACSALIRSGRYQGANLAAVYYRRGTLQSSEAFQFPKAIADFNQSIRLKPAYPEAFLGRGIAHLRQRQYDVARKDFDEAIRLAPNLGDAYRWRGITYETRSERARAIQDYDMAIRLNGEDAEAFSRRCYCRVLLDQLEAALADCSRSLTLKSSRNQDALYNRAFVQLRMGRWDAAIADYDAYLALSRSDAHALYGRGFAYRKKGDAARAGADIAAATKLRPDIANVMARLGVK